MNTNYDRAAEDLGNIVGLEHVNIRVPDQHLATLFYVTGLGLTRDPYLVTGVVNMWINVGRSQFHLPTGDPQLMRGQVGLVVPDIAALGRRLEAMRDALADTAFKFAVRGPASRRYIDVTCPWGNRIHCHGPGKRYGRVVLGMPYLAFDVAEGTAEGIARFYREVMLAPATLEPINRRPAARVSAGPCQDLIFRETKAPAAPYDGHHIQVYVADFSEPHAQLRKRGLVTEESNQHQYRFLDIVDPKNGKALFRLEHEVRSMTHPLYARPLVNRNPEQTNNAFAPGHEECAWAMPYS